MSETTDGSTTLDRTLTHLGLTGTAGAVLAIAFGALIIAFPDLIAWLVGGYLIVAGAVRLAGHLESERHRGTKS